jgi:hypothetical protein
VADFDTTAHAAATVADLIPGDVVTNPSIDGAVRGVFIARVPHPDYPALMLVIWRLDDASFPWSFDALDPRQEVGELAPSTDRDRADRLRAVLLGNVPW